MHMYVCNVVIYVDMWVLKIHLEFIDINCDIFKAEYC